MSGRAQMTTMNGKRPSPMPQRHHQNESSSQHFDLIKYIHESWNSVSKELDNYHNQQHGNSSNYRNSGLVTYYQEHEPNPLLKDFEPFNLEAYWNQRGLQSMARNATS
ncbi:mapk-regulated corepressor-interacting protein 1-like isoform X2 [Phymastichus coffea]|uniref:mapk-regulated corepressor-interacting protein 1-like isoform X2 n=1 Tax=Phymastichus coffea TaxID=108790 RepID=UPI00273AC636|nr:mapk-regulated corepressor-interacting protein 1-like isoform X2 [Phymastichus coffea]